MCCISRGQKCVVFQHEGPILTFVFQHEMLAPAVEDGVFVPRAAPVVSTVVCTVVSTVVSTVCVVPSALMTVAAVPW